MTAATKPDQIDWPRPEQIAAGYFQDRLHRVRPGALAIHLAGGTYYAADCGAMAVPTNEPPETWAFCDACWPCGRPNAPVAPNAEPHPEPTALPDCLDWSATFETSFPRRAEPPLLVAMALTTGSPTPTGATPGCEVD